MCIYMYMCVCVYAVLCVCVCAVYIWSVACWWRCSRERSQDCSATSSGELTSLSMCICIYVHIYR